MNDSDWSTKMDVKMEMWILLFSGFQRQNTCILNRNTLFEYINIFKFSMPVIFPFKKRFHLSLEQQNHLCISRPKAVKFLLSQLFSFLNTVTAFAIISDWTYVRTAFRVKFAMIYCDKTSQLVIKFRRKHVLSLWEYIERGMCMCVCAREGCLFVFCTRLWDNIACNAL